MSGFVECDVGMTEYIGKNEGFSAILKLRYEDFLVNEIDKDENVLRFTEESYKEIVEKSPTPDILDTGSSFGEDISSNIFSSEEKEKLKQLEESEKNNLSVIIHAENDKAARTRIHGLIRQFHPNLESETFKDPSDGDSKIKITKCNVNERKRRRNWPAKDKKKLYRFLLYKENISTMDAVNLILKKLHLNHSKCFQYAGNKDKRAITVQAMTTSLPPSRLISINRMVRNIRVGNFLPCQTHLQLGDLTGNHFSIALRNINDIEREDMENAISTFSNIGFINYFGMQRFGTTGTSTYKIGKALLGSKWDDAVDLILSSVKEDDEDVVKMIKSWREDDHASEALKKMRCRSSFEGFLLRGISQYGTKQLVQALSRIPRPTRLLYLHSYQSYLWNRVVSRRLRDFGLKPIVGDLVYASETLDQIEGADVNEEDFESNCLQKKKRKLDDDRSTNVGSLPEVKVLSEEDVANYQITDVVVPLPGDRVVYPSKIREWYVQLLAEDQLELNAFNHRVKDYYLAGAYRRVIVRPNNVSWDLVRYSDIDKSLLVTDYNKLQGKLEAGGCDATGKFQALRIHFDLPSSSYASVAVRELTKSDMSIPVQTRLGDAHKRAVAEEHSRRNARASSVGAEVETPCKATCDGDVLVEEKEAFTAENGGSKDDVCNAHVDDTVVDHKL